MFSTQAEFERAIRDACFFTAGTATMGVFEDIKAVLYIDPAGAAILPHEYVNNAYAAYRATGRASNSLNGNVFELIIYCLLAQKEIEPFFTQTQLSLVPHVEFDLVLYALDDNEFDRRTTGQTKAQKQAVYNAMTNGNSVKIKPICISLKTSTRERFKQADLEAYILKNVHRNADCYLMVLNAEDCNSINEKIAENACLALKKAVAASTTALDDFIQTLCTDYTFVKPKPIPVYRTGREYTR